MKTVASVRDPHRVGRWLWQLLAYAWLDTGDRHRIRAVGLYLARHGVVVTWSLPELTAALMPDRDPDDAVARFRGIARQLLAAEAGGWRPPSRGDGATRPEPLGSHSHS